MVDNITKDVRNLFELKKENETIKDRITKDIRNIFQLENKVENYYKPIGVGNFYSNNYIEYKDSGDRSKTQSIEHYLNKIRPHLKDIINNLKKPDAWKIQLTIAIHFVFERY